MHISYFYLEKIFPKALKCFWSYVKIFSILSIIIVSQSNIYPISCTILSKIYLIVIRLIIKNREQFHCQGRTQIFIYFSKISYQPTQPIIQSIILNKLKITFNLYSTLYLKLKFL